MAFTLPGYFDCRAVADIIKDTLPANTALDAAYLSTECHIILLSSESSEKT
jgi:hypothetical protein